MKAGVDLAELARRTRISPSVLRLLDRGEFERLPAGIYARSYIRAVARTLGVDPDETLRDVESLLPSAQWGEPPAQDARGTMSEEARPTPGPTYRAGNTMPQHTTAAPRSSRALGETSGARNAARSGARLAPGPTYHAASSWQNATARPLLQRVLATSVDCAVLASVHAGIFAITTIVADVPAPALWHHAAPALVAVWALVTACYFLAFAGVRGATPGEMVSGVHDESPAGPVPLSDLVRRAAAALLTELSIVVDAALRTERWAGVIPVRSE